MTLRDQFFFFSKALLFFRDTPPDHGFQFVQQLLVLDFVIRLAVDIDKIIGSGARQSQFRLLGFTWAVDDTADNGHIDGRDDVLDPALEFIHRCDDIEILARAARAGGNVHTLASKVQAFQDVEAYLDFFHRVRGKGYPDGIANAFHQQHADTHGRLYGARPLAARLGNTKMQRLVYLRGDGPVGFHCHKYVGRFHAEFEILEVFLVQQVDIAQRRLHHGGGVGFLVLAQQILAQGAGIDADANRDIPVLAGAHHGFDAVRAADVARQSRGWCQL